MNALRTVCLVAFVALVASGCSSLPGLRVLTGEDTGDEAVSRSVEALDLVMADKTGSADPSLLAAADRLEAAAGNIDVIEIRPDADGRAFLVNLLYAPPQVPQTLEGQVMALDDQRRAFELTWQAVLPESGGTDTIVVNFIYPRPVTTLDSGDSFIGQIFASAGIDRADAASYLSGERSLNNWYGLILDGTLSFSNPEQAELYQGRPNHPMFMLDLVQAAS